MKKLTEQLQEIESYIPFMDKKKESVSAVTIGWQLDHALRVINSVVKALEQSKPEEYKYKLNMLRHFFLTVKTFPRGKSKAPNVVRPEDDVAEQDVRKHLKFAYKNIQKLSDFPPKANFPHPYFGQLNLKQSINFIAIHTHHHLKIIRSIHKTG